MMSNQNIKIPSATPRFLTALQFGITITILLDLVIGLMCVIFGDTFFFHPRHIIIFSTIGVLTVSPFFYRTNRSLGIDELKKGMYEAKAAKVLDFNDTGMLIEIGETKVALSHPMLYNITIADLTDKSKQVLYIKTQRGHVFITSL